MIFAVGQGNDLNAFWKLDVRQVQAFAQFQVGHVQFQIFWQVTR